MIGIPFLTRYHAIYTFFIVFLGLQCDQSDQIADVSIKKTPNEQHVDCDENLQAQVTDVKVNGSEGNYTFSVIVKSPDTGCDQYADWWEVITPDSTLIYRRILTHSHVSEQPFTRSGGPVKTSSDAKVIIRAHMNNLGYGCIVYSGNISEGFYPDTISSHFALSLSEMEPLPAGCAF